MLQTMDDHPMISQPNAFPFVVPGEQQTQRGPLLTEEPQIISLQLRNHFGYDYLLPQEWGMSRNVKCSSMRSELKNTTCTQEKG